MADVYKYGTSEKVKVLQGNLSDLLKEIKNELEENELVHGIPQKTISSVEIPKDADYFERERKIIIDRAMDVCEAKPLTIQSEVMKEEMENSLKFEYTIDSLPLLLHQYFIDRIHQLVQSKHLHMLRWKRFCEHTSTIEAMYPLYQKRLHHIMSEYNDCLSRAERLAVARECFLVGNNSMAVQAVQPDDMIIYLRWLVCHLHSVKKFNQFISVVKWLPISGKSTIHPNEGDSDVVEETRPSSSRYGSRYDDNLLRPDSAASRPESGKSVRSTTPKYIPPPQAPPVNPVAISSNPASASTSFLNTFPAAGGGMISDETTLCLPLHVNDFDSIWPHLNYLVNMYAHYLNMEKDLTLPMSSSDEMELFATVNRKFRVIFSKQETLKTFKTYDKIELGLENWGADSSNHALKQVSNWLPYVTLQSECDPAQEKQMTALRQQNSIDELLRVKSKFLQISDPERVHDALRDHAVAVRNPRSTQPAMVQSNRTTGTYHTGIIWKKIYANPDLFLDLKEGDELGIQDFDEKEADNVNFSPDAARPKSASKRRRDSYNYLNTVQMLGLDDGDQDESDPASIQGAYLSFLHLRHVRIRDLQRTCLSILNYFRSVERTLTINDGGLSLEADHFKRASNQNHRKGVPENGSIGLGGGLGSHAYMHNTPKDYKISETEFMEFSDIENHHDFYTLDEGRVHVQDQRGYYIMYDTALQDMKNLEHDLLLISTHYIQKDRELRTKCNIQRSQSAKQRQHHGAGDFEIPCYGHQEVDRFAVLLDLWSNEAAYLESKKNLLDCYLEAYHHVFDRDERHNLAQVITDVVHKRPRFDFDAPYFVKTYRLECINVRLHATLIKSILDKQIEDQREYTQKVCPLGQDRDFGLPYTVVAKQPISVNMSRSALRNIYMLEFHPSLAIASCLPEALKHAYWQLHQAHKPETVTDEIIMEKKLLEHACKEWERMESIGAPYSTQTQKDLFEGVYVENPQFVTEIAYTKLKEAEEKLQRNSNKEKQIGKMEAIARVMEVITLRHRLIEYAWETSVLSKIYRKLAVNLGYDEYHLFLRFVQFEFAVHKETAGKPPPLFITSVLDDDSDIDRYVPPHLYLAIHELDESHVGRFNFRSRDGMLQILRGQCVESLQVILMSQTVHKNAILAAVQQADACTPAKAFDKDAPKSPRETETLETKSERSSVTNLSAFGGGPSAANISSKLTAGYGKAKSGCQEAFVSIQLEKGPSRDLMLNEYVHKKSSMGTVLKNPDEVEKLKRRLIAEYCRKFNNRISQYSLRGQILANYNSILGLLEEFPNIRETYFIIGDTNEKKHKVNDSVEGLTVDAREFKSRPRRVLSADGSEVLNIWFVPHYTEMLIMFKTMDDESCHRALAYLLEIVSALHDIVQYLCAHSKLGSSRARMGTQKMEFVSADWGGSEGIGAELREIQQQIDNLEDPTSPAEVGTFMQLRREVMFLEFDTAVRHSMRDTFLSTGNVHAYKNISKNMHFALPFLSNVQFPSLNSTYLNIPEPMEAYDFRAHELYPWRAFIGSGGPYPDMFWQWHQIEHNLQLCLAGLKDVDRHVANGEILGVSLLMEDVLSTGHCDIANVDYMEADEEEHDNNPASKRATPKPSRPGTSKSVMSIADSVKSNTGTSGHKPLSRTQQPLESYQLLKSFLNLWKRLEVFKTDWGKRKLGLEKIETPSQYREFCRHYRKEILFPILKSVARRYGQGELYQGIINEFDPLVTPQGASEIEIRSRQLIKLCEMVEIHMISEVEKKVSKELTLVLAERSREEGTIPTDLWKKPVMKESFTIAKPHIAQLFSTQLFCDASESKTHYSFPKEHFDKCIVQLESSVMARERSNYENYSMYYENLLRVHHQLLYQREQEVKGLNDQLQETLHNTDVEVQCQLADKSHDLLMEITALRSKVGEMRENAMHQERDIRERVREEYDSLVQNLFTAAYELKTKFENYREKVHDDVKAKVTEVRREYLDQMKIKSNVTKADDEILKRNLAKAEQVRDMQKEKHGLIKLMITMKSLNNWKQFHTRQNYASTMFELQKKSDQSKKDCLNIRMTAEEEVILLRQQQVALRKALAMSEKECSEAKKDLEKELKLKEERAHAAAQKARSQKQLEAAKQANVEKLFEELEMKEKQLEALTDEKEKTQKVQAITYDKVKKDVYAIKKQLSHEQKMKLDAFSRVDELQSQMYDFESGLFSRPVTSLGIASSIRSKSRASSPEKRSTRPATVSSSTMWPPPVQFPPGQNRSITPDLSSVNLNNYTSDQKLIQRPKTVPGRLRSKLAEQLINELDAPDSHETIMRLQAMQLQSGSKSSF